MKKSKHSIKSDIGKLVTSGMLRLSLITAIFMILGIATTISVVNRGVFERSFSAIKSVLVSDYYSGDYRALWTTLNNTGLFQEHSLIICNSSGQLLAADPLRSTLQPKEDECANIGRLTQVYTIKDQNTEIMQIVGTRKSELTAVALIAAALLVMMTICGLIFTRKMVLSISNRVNNYIDGIPTLLFEALSGKPMTQTEPEELHGLGDNIRSFAKKNQELLDQIRLKETSEAQFQIAQQVAHDIRSPIAAIAMAEKEFGALPEETRILVRSAMGRIKDIANQLDEKTRSTAKFTANPGHADTTETTSILLLSGLIDGMTSEKRMQYRSQMDIGIDAQLEDSYGLFAKIQPTEFKRVMSNLVNNSVEAIGHKGNITIHLFAIDGRELQIEVRDNGKGIPPEILAKLGQRGETHGKAGGFGLGLYHARTSIESWGGKLELQSELGRGTTVIIKLPQADAPAWFVAELQLAPQSKLITLDDDESIHRIWDGRAESAKLVEQDVKIIHLSTPAGLRTWVTEAKNTAVPARYLFDYELLGFKETGLDLIEELGLATQAVLVTSRYEDPSIREHCERLRVPLIPKGMAGFVPIRVVTAEKNASVEQLDAILIDDDEIVHMCWKVSARQAGCKYRGFKSVDEFFSQAANFDYGVPIYIDSFLGKDKNGVESCGQVAAKEIFELGFRQIYLATGLPPSAVEQMPWLYGVRQKEPPFAESGFKIRRKDSEKI